MILLTAVSLPTMMKTLRTGKVKVKYSALWMYNKLIGCRTVEQIQATKDTCFQHMDRKYIAHLNKLTDTSQYPAARCNMCNDVYMHHRQA